MDSIDRRAFLKSGVFLASGAALAGLVGCSQPAQNTADTAGSDAEAALPDDLKMTDIQESLVELDPITDFADEQTFDIVVVGAGCSGIPAIVTALEEGATVGCLQKQSTPVANGYGASAVNLDASTKAGALRWMEQWGAQNNYRMRRGLFRHYLDHSAETVSWMIKKSKEIGLEPASFKTSGSVIYEDGETAAVFEISSQGNDLVMKELGKQAEEQGAVFFYETPCVQLIQDDDGTATGAIGKNSNGEYIRLNAKKAVILATGDYVNNSSMMNRFSRDVEDRYLKLLVDRTGDGHILGMLAGARIAPLGHPRQIHGLIPWFMTVPLLMLNPEGNRFMSENVHMTAWNSALTEHYPQGEEAIVYRFFDSEYLMRYEGMGALPPKEEVLDKSIDEGTPSSPYDFHNAFHRADTIEELCAEVGLPYEAARQSIDRYNELSELGRDEDFGVPGAMLRPIATAPFYCIKDKLGLAGVNAGFTVDDNYQAVDTYGNPIPNLYGAGVCADNVCGGINWAMPGGFSNTHCFAGGRYTVLHALKGNSEPTNRCSFDEVADHFKDSDGLFQWEKPETARKSIEVW